jgi:hypothetical protein
MCILSKVSDFLCELFDYPTKFIKDTNIKINIRKSKISINDAIFYRFKYIFEENSNTFEAITSFINVNNTLENKKHKQFSRTAIYKKEKKLPVELYKNMFTQAKQFFYKITKCNNMFISIDGVYSNTNVQHNGKVETSMSLGFYDNCSNIPLDIHFTGVFIFKGIY